MNFEFPRFHSGRSARQLAAFAVLALTGTLASAIPASAVHAASCVAALKARETGLAVSINAGEPVENEMLMVVRSGIAIIGTQYLSGLRESEARQLLDAAEKDFDALPRRLAEARQASCLQEGDGLYRHASPIERTLIGSAAKRRMQRVVKSVAESHDAR